MKTLLIIILTVTNSYLLCAQNCDCTKFRTGTFEIANPDGTVSTVVRTETQQTEKNGRSKIIADIIWVDNCTFKIVPTSIKDKTNTIGPQTIRCTFIETMDHAYIAHVSLEGEDFEMDAKVYEKGYLNYDRK